MISGCSSSCGIEQKFTWHIHGWGNSTQNMAAAVSLPQRQFHEYCIITWNLVSHPNDAHNSPSNSTASWELGFLFARATKGWCFLCSVLSEQLNLSRATTTPFYQDTSYRSGWRSSTTIKVPYKFHSLSCSLCHVQFVCDMWLILLQILQFQNFSLI